MKNWKYIEGAKVGNATPNYRYKDFLITNPEGHEYVVFLKDGRTVGYRGTTSKAQAEDWCDWHDPKTGKPVKNKKTGNGVFSIFKSDKPIKMKSPQGAIVTINPDGTAAHQDKEGGQMAVHPHNSFKEAVEYYKSQGYVKVGNAMAGRPYDMGKQLGKEDADYGRYKTREQLKKYFEVEDNNQLNEIERGYKKGQEEYEDRYTFNSRTGNESLGEYMAKKPRVINEEKTGAEEFFKKLSDDVKEREDKDDADIEKVGNKIVWKEGPYRIEEVEKDGKFGFYNIPKGSFNAYRNSVLYGNFKTLDRAKAKMNEEIRLDKEYNRKYTTNSKTGNLQHYKVGNARYTTREDIISHLDTDLYDICKKMPSGTTPWAYLLELQKKGWDMNTISKYSKEIGKIVDRYKAGNAKTGNKKLKFTDKKDGKIEYVYDEESKDGYIYYDGKLVDTKKAVGPGWVDLIKQKAFSSGVMNKTGNAFTSSDKKRLDELARKKPTQLTPQEWKEFQDLNKREEEASREMLKKSGNSASDDKFAYVMREFDEGKLKTPDGKVVTDPAQAKAIAYSESKKTENGLARARNAMAKNKKVRNSAVREYKHSDGRVAQIDFNEDGSDADMSIYEGTKEIEQRNFSTIRDAEQYVISHGFRRIF